MTTQQTMTFFSLCGAAVMTIAMLAGVNGLATSEARDAQLAHAAAASPRPELRLV